MEKVYVIATPDEMRLVPSEGREKCRVIMTGVGGTNVIRALKDLDRDTWIVNVGFAGSCDLPKGAWVWVAESRLYHTRCNYDEPVFRLADSGVVCRTSCDFVTRGKKGEIYDMELAFICSLGFAKVEAYKTISDNCSYEEYEQTVALYNN